jgi:hypothetical protein
MTIQLTLTDLVKSLRKASANPEAHKPAQLMYFSPLQDNSVLTHCGTACCIAGDLFLQAHADASENVLKGIIDRYPITTWTWVADQLGLTYVEATLAFDSRTHCQVHALLADLFESGLRLYCPDSVVMSSKNTYTEFHRASIGAGDCEGVDLEGLLDLMESIAQ